MKRILFLLVLFPLFCSAQILDAYPKGQEFYRGGITKLYEDVHEVFTKFNIKPCENKNEFYNLKLVVNKDASISLVKDYDELAIKENSCAYEKAKLAVSNILGWQPAEVEGQKFPAVVEVPFYPASLFSGYRAGYTAYQYFKPVSYPGGQKALEDDLKQYFMGLFFDYQINGDLVMIFKIDRYGHIYDLVLESRIENEEFKKDIIKTIKRFNKKKTWIPASIHGQPVASEFHYTANFTTTYR